MPGVTPTFGALRTASAALALASLLKNSVAFFAFMKREYQRFLAIFELRPLISDVTWPHAEPHAW